MSTAFPDYCERPAPRLERNIMTSMLDLMPAPGLIFNEWDKHGTCSGLGARAYFETIRKARAAVKIPPEFIELADPKTVAPAEIEDAFVKVNPGLTTCRDRGDLQPDPAQRSAHLHEQGSPVPRLRGNRSPRLPARPGRDAAGARRLSKSETRHCEERKRRSNPRHYSTAKHGLLRSARNDVLTPLP